MVGLRRFKLELPCLSGLAPVGPSQFVRVSSVQSGYCSILCVLICTNNGST